MRLARFASAAAFICTLAASGAVIRGDQPIERSHEHNGPPATDDPADDMRMSAMGRLAHLSATGRLEKALEKARGRRRGLIERIHIEELIDEARGGEEDEGEEAPAGGQAETSMAVDATGQHIVVGFNDTRGFSLNPIRVSGFMYSDDGGATFTDGGQLPVATARATIGTTILPQVFGDPEVKYLGGGNFIYFSIMVKKFTATGAAQTMGIHRSTDFGHTWEGPYEIPSATNPHGLLTAAQNARDSADKEFADVDPETGRVLMSWSNFTSTAFAPGGVEISSTFSDDVLSATPPAWSTRRIIAATAADGQASVPRFAAGSAEVYVAWRRFPGGLNQNVGFARSTDNGATFSAAVNVAPSHYQLSDEILGNDRTNNSPSLAADRGNIYVVYANNTSNDGADIAFQRSTDGGLTFSAPVLINSRPGGDRAQWFPWVAADVATGRVYVFYYDQGIRTAGDLTETTMLYSDDGGSAWSRPMPLSDRPFHAAYGNDTGQPNLGDYNQAVAQSGELFAVWAGTRPVGYADGQPTSSFTTPDVVFKRLPSFSTKVALSLNPVTFSDAGGNGFIDPGEMVSFPLELFNYYTNIGAAAIGGISATLASSTAGVSVVNGTRSYPPIAPGTSAASAGTFDVQLSPGFVAGTPIECSLDVTTADGPTRLLFTQATGTPVTTTIFSENFDGVAPGSLPAGWATSHAGGTNTVPWTTNDTFMGTGSNAAFHTNAADGPTASNNTRFERLFSPNIVIPPDAEYVLLDFDVAYDTEDEPSFNVLTYDGFLLRITDFTPGRFGRAVQIESFAEEFTTGGVDFYPKHMPRNSNVNYLQDLSAWGGFSNGITHVRLKLPGMAGSTVQLRWEFTQDSIAICSDVRPGHTCGVAVDNIVMRKAISVAGTQTTVASSQDPSDLGEPVTFAATVTSTKPLAGGNVTFKEGATILAGPTAIDSAGQATFTTSALPAGPHTIVAEFSDGPGFAPSSGAVVQHVDSLPAVSIDDVAVHEGDAGPTTALFTVSLSAATHTATAQVTFASADGSATTAGGDYASTSGSIAFAPGEISHTIAVTINGDIFIEPNETFFVNLSGASHATLADGQGAGTILNDDSPASSISALAVQVGACPATLTSGQCQALLTRLRAALGDVSAGQLAGAARALEQFIHEVTIHSSPIPGAGGPPRLDAATAATWIAEARSAIAALTP